MTLQGLRYFVSAARHENFTRAAQECHVTQPALSRAIAELERELGCRLFERGAKGPELTEPGRVCFREAKRLLRQAEAMQEQVRRSVKQQQGHLKVGYIIMGHLNALNKYLLTYLKDHPHLEADTVYDSAANIRRRLLSGELDMAVLPQACVGDLPPHEYAVLTRHGLNILVNRGHPLFACESIYLKMLSGHRLIFWDREDLPNLYQAHQAACEQVGFQPNVVGTARKLGDMVTETATKNAVGFVSRAYPYVETPDLRVIPVADCPDGFDVVLVRLLEGENPCAGPLLRYIDRTR